ncbi:MAG: UDP-N-acetylglucosamine--N-acetylmuramyl-(pentapeptide) pyrophosphoryl-undecaprenol N-acetylglucosamine transferase [Algisphaera sp.]
MSSSAPPTILFAGGGSGGHIFPNLAVIERLRRAGMAFTPHLLVSSRPLDAKVAREAKVAYTAVPAAPLALKPAAALRFVRGYRAGRAAVAAVIEQTNAQALLATGGFVSAPAVAAAKRAGLPVALVNLDAAAGRANRRAAAMADAVFNATPPHPGARSLANAQVVGYPLRRSARPREGKAEARKRLGLDPSKRTLLVFAGSQGAQTINRALLALLRGSGKGLLSGTQVLHLTGGGDSAAADRAALEEAYREAHVPAVVRPFCNAMGEAWAAADLALTRAGAGTVAEAWANAVPCVMLPYPYHRDEHQKFNAAPLVVMGGAVVEGDMIEPEANVEMLRKVLGRLLKDEAQRSSMQRALRENPPKDGAKHLAAWVANAAKLSAKET